MSSKVAIMIAFIATSALAAPLAARNSTHVEYHGPYSNSTGHDSYIPTDSYSPPESSNPPGSYTPPDSYPIPGSQEDLAFYPAVYHYNVGTGAIDCHAEGGLISKSPTNHGNDITTLLTFTYPNAAEGRQCQFQFYLNEDAFLSGSGKIDVFTSNAPAPGCRSSWGPGNQRNVNLGRLSARLGGFAVWDATYGAYLTEPTGCKPPGTREGFELVGVYDYDHISWEAEGSGARIIIL